MEYTLKNEPEYLHLTLKGELTLTAANWLAGEVINHAIRNKTEKVFIDARESVWKMSVIDRYEHIDSSAKAIREATAEGKLSPDLRLVFVIRSAHFDPDRFAESIAQRRGVHSKIFNDDPEAALEWLGVRSVAAPARSLVIT